MKRRVISILDQSVGETTSTFTLQLANALVEQSYRVLVVDANPDAHLTQALGMQSESGLADAMLHDVPIEQIMKPVAEQLHIISAGQALADYEQQETGGLQRAKKLKQLLDQPIMKEQNFILIVAPEKQGLLMINALFAASEVIAPTGCDFSSLQNAVQGVKAFRRVESVIGRNTKLWLALSQIGAAGQAFEQIKAEVLATFPSRAFKTVLEEKVATDKNETKWVGQSSIDFASLAQDVVLGRTY